MYTLFYLTTFLKNNNLIRNILNKIAISKFYNAKCRVEKIRGIKYKNDVVSICVVAFNNKELIELQYKSISKFLENKFNYLVFDNSNDEIEAKRIEGVCNDLNLTYIRLPKNKLKSSISHGIALNYIMKNFIKKYGFKFFGFLDHDCILVKNLNIIEILKKEEIYGCTVDYIPVRIGKRVRNMAGGRRFLWAGCCFYVTNIFEKGFDFTINKKMIPLSFLDTGGGNWDYIYKKYLLNSLSSSNPQVHKKIGDYMFGSIGDHFIHLGGGGYRNKSDVKNMLKIMSTLIESE